MIQLYTVSIIHIVIISTILKLAFFNDGHSMAMILGS